MFGVTSPFHRFTNPRRDKSRATYLLLLFIPRLKLSSRRLAELKFLNFLYIFSGYFKGPSENLVSEIIPYGMSSSF